MSVDAFSRRRIAFVALAVLAAVVCVHTALTAPLGADYPGPPHLGDDFAGPPIQALAGLHFGSFFVSQPFMGPVTLVLRAPFVALTNALSLDLLWQYRIGCLVCLLAAAAVLCWAAVQCAAAGARRASPAGASGVGVVRGLVIAGAIVLLLGGPLTGKALFWGHPEEIVGAALCVAGILLAGRGRPTLAGVTLGLALATKQWALLAFLPAALAAPAGQRLRLLAVSCGVAAALLVPMLIGDPSHFIYQNVHAGMVLSGAKLANVTPTNVWFALRAGVTEMINGQRVSVAYQIPSSVAKISHPLAIALGLTTALALVPDALARRHARGPVPLDGDAATRAALMALALAFLVRCLLDPLTISYHHVPFLIVLCACELMSARAAGVPWLSVYSSVALWALGRYAAPSGNDTLFNQLYLAWGLPLAGYLTYRLVAFARTDRGTAATASARRGGDRHATAHGHPALAAHRQLQLARQELL